MTELQVWHKIAFISLVAILFLAAGYKSLTERSEQAALLELRNGLTFSNTQTWDPEYTDVLLNRQDIIALYKPQIKMTPPPTDFSLIQSELDLLHSYEAQRTPEKITEIKRELELELASFSDQTFLGMLVGKPKTKELLVTALDLIEPVEVAFKAEFDRVRPSILDPSLTTAIDIPNHPAYPSYHAAESMLIALILSELDPIQSTIYIADAKRIAHNREIAGVHYPSDSLAGQQLANDILVLFRKEEWYQNLLLEAKTEWSN